MYKFMAYLSTHLLHLRTMTITIAPIRADMIETMIRVNAHPSSPAVSAKEETAQK